jgi:GNAT superfamily N-acetyltransferase
VLARRDGEPAARAVAVVDERYRAHWNNDPLGHVILYEALPDARDETRAVMDAACGWLREQGMQAARTGFGMQDMPYVVDDYDSLPPIILRHNPAEYHAHLKDAGFESEQGWVDYKIRVTPELVDRWERSLEGARRAGFEIVPLREVPTERRAAEFAATWAEAFAEHWGNVPWSTDEFGAVFDLIGPLGMYDTSVLGYRDGEPAGALWVTPELSGAAETVGRPLRDDEKLNWLGIGVRKPARGTGLNMAMASYAFLELVRRGATWVSYTLVLDDNWPSRRTGEKLGGSVCANYMTYRRNFRH